MKKALLTSALALSLAIPAIGFAQTTDAPAGGPGMHRGMNGPHHGMFKDLNLTPKQDEQIRAIMQKQHQEAQRQVRAILTPEQQKKFDAKVAQMEAHKQQRMERRQQQQNKPKQ